MEYGALFLSAVLVNNFVLTRFLGLCIFFGVSNSFEASLGMGVAVTAVMVVASLLGWCVYFLVLVPLELTFFTTICFVLIIASTVQMVDIVTRRFVPKLHAMWGIYLMLIATNCVVLRLPAKTFTELIMTHPQILEAVSQVSESRELTNAELLGEPVTSDDLVRV